MSKSARQCCVLIGIALLIIAGIILYMSLGSPRVYVTPDSSTVPHSEYNDYTEQQGSSLVNINYATKDELSTIDGVGDAIAEQIIGYRQENGGFASIDELKNIKGIGDKKFRQIAPYVTV